VLRRGPTAWWHLLRWDLATLRLTAGAWFRGNLYPRRCDISADGRLFGYFALKGSRRTPGWPDTYFAVSKVPWLEALVAWKTCGTWTWGCQFSARGDLEVRACLHHAPFHGSFPKRLFTAPMGVHWTERDIWNEMKRGWRYAVDSDPLWIEDPTNSSVVLKREQPNVSSPWTLGLIHNGVSFGRGGVEGVRTEYFLQLRPDAVTPLPNARWADWDQEGRLLTATRDGRLEVYTCRANSSERIWEEDLRDRAPEPQPAPPWATSW
jgi:hypothetical protein